MAAPHVGVRQGGTWGKAERRRELVEVRDRDPEVRIDAAPVGTFTAAELAAGVGLGALDTPMAAQAERVHALTLAHDAVHRARWRQVEVRLAGYDLPEERTALAALDRLE